MRLPLLDPGAGSRPPAPVPLRIVEVNRRCNQGCGFCDRRAASDGAEHEAAEIEARVRAAAAAGPGTTVRFDGGEPGLREELPRWIALARDAGARVTLATNGTLYSYPARARDVARAGLAEAEVAIPAGDDAIADRITRDPGGLARALRGLRELSAAGVDLSITIPLTDAALPTLPRLVSRVADAVSGPGRLRGVRAHLLRGVALDPRAAARSLLGAAAVASRLPNGGVLLRMDPGLALPPCAFDGAATDAAIGAGLLDGLRGAPAAPCAGCALHGPGLCPGPGEGVPEDALRALDGEQARALAPLLGERPGRLIADAVSPFHFFDEPSGGLRPGVTVRLVYGCNQKCPMCFVDTTLDAVPERLWRDAIAAAGATGCGDLQISGGEPTLAPRLADAIALARSSGIPRVELQTNALRCADPAYARGLADAGLTHALVSLHGASDPVADAVTLAPGTARRTRLGIDALLDAGIAVQIHFVVNGLNFAEAPGFVDGVLARWGTRPALLFSFVAPMDRVPKEPWLVPRLSAIAGPLRAALDRCLAAGLRFTGPGSFCGIPLCILDGDPRYYPDRHPVPAGSVSTEFEKPPACVACTLSPDCRGIRSAYAALHGVDELRPA